MNFYGRTTQLKKLHKEIELENMRTVLIYGRRRVGKSELVKQAIRESKARSIYYECKQTTEANNVESLGAVVSDCFGMPKLGFSGMEEMLDFIFKQSLKEKIVLVLDEYSYLADIIKGMDSILQSLIDRYRDDAKITFIILGSYVETMKRLLDHSNPLFGRMDLVIDLKPMDYYESAQFYNNYSEEDKVRIYSVFGGIPYYNRLIDDSKSVKENIIELIASPGARLENEIQMYLRSEISKIVNANEVFEALAAGNSKYKDILSKSHVSSGPTLIDVLDKLMRMEVVIKTAPINDEKNKKKSGYFISDNLSSFYFRYIFRYSSQMSVMDPEMFFEKYIEKDFEKYYVPKKFEDICRQYLIKENKNGNITPVFEKIGKYYYDDPVNHSNGEFDIVTEDEKGYVFYEVKFKKNPITQGEIDEEIEQVKKCGLDCYKYVFISRSGFKDKPGAGVEYIGLEKLYASN